MNKKERIIKRRKELEKKLRHRMDELSDSEKSNLQAIAIKYDQSQKKAPTIVASGRGNVAKSILEIAEENDIPMMEDKDLAKLLSSLKLKSEIPVNLFKIIAEILAFIFYLERMAKKKLNIKKKYKGLS